MNSTNDALREAYDTGYAAAVAKLLPKKVYVVCWTESYGGALVKGVFLTEEEAQAYIDTKDVGEREWYSIEEHEV